MGPFSAGWRLVAANRHRPPHSVSLTVWLPWLLLPGVRTAISGLARWCGSSRRWMPTRSRVLIPALLFSMVPKRSSYLPSVRSVELTLRRCVLRETVQSGLYFRIDLALAWLQKIALDFDGACRDLGAVTGRGRVGCARRVVSCDGCVPSLRCRNSRRPILPGVSGRQVDRVSSVPATSKWWKREYQFQKASTGGG